MRYQKRCVVIRKQLALSEVVDYYVDVGTVKPLILPLPRVPCCHVIYCVLPAIHACCSLQYYRLLLLSELDL